MRGPGKDNSDGLGLGFKVMVRVSHLVNKKSTRFSSGITCKLVSSIVKHPGVVVDGTQTSFGCGSLMKFGAGKVSVVGTNIIKCNSTTAVCSSSFCKSALDVRAVVHSTIADRAPSCTLVAKKRF